MDVTTQEISSDQASQWLDWYRTMTEIRYFEEKVDELFQQGRIHGTMHLYVGEEAVATGACAALQPNDYITSTHRGHGHGIAKGADLGRMMAEILGRATGYCKGKGGSMHIADVESGNLGANGVVAAGIPIAVGAALTCRMKETGQVVLCFFGDGATNEGAFHEALNLAAIWKLPVVFLCENNQYGMSGSVKKMLAIPRISMRAESYGMPGETIDGNDVLQVYERVWEAANRARNGGGPTLIEAVTYRWKGHSKSDARAYRTREEEQEWKARDPIARFRDFLLEKGVLNREQAMEVEELVQRRIEEAVRFAEQSPQPSFEDLENDVYA